MSYRVSALISVAAILGLSAFTPVSAQPQVPVRPRYGAFQSIFAPGQVPLANPGAGFLGQQMAFGNPAGPQVPGFVYPGTLTYPQGQPLVFAVDPRLRPTGIVGQFNNLGHWYGSGSLNGGLGHWYPNGRANGRGVLGYGGGYGGGYAGLYGGGLGTTSGGFGGAALPVLSTGLTGGAAINQFRR